ncbi:MAG: response regulator [Anaerolineae bacterium]|nr:response regulator [Anaerolineae bacterium]
MANHIAIRILYIEDDHNLQLSMSQMLKILGYEVVCADNGRDGVEKAESWKPDVILTDMRMPYLNGDEVIRTLRGKPDTTKIPVFVISAYTDAKTRNLCKEAGADRFYAKPVDIFEINQDIKAVLNHQEQM